MVEISGADSICDPEYGHVSCRARMRSTKQKPEPLGPAVWRVVAVAALGPLLSTLDATVINVSLSTLERELHASISTIQWVISGYLLALALVLPLTGWIVDRIGAKRLYLICFSAFSAASMLCGLAWSAPSLIFFRVLQGIAGGLLAPMAQMMMARVAGQQMARVMGYAAFPILLGPILDPVLAGQSFSTLRGAGFSTSTCRLVRSRSRSRS
jgi:MFS family permease